MSGKRSRRFVAGPAVAPGRSLSTAEWKAEYQPVNAILAIPIELRLLGLAIIGAWLGSLLNLAIYRLAY